jgi:hypothetical protein
MAFVSFVVRGFSALHSETETLPIFLYPSIDVFLGIVFTGIGVNRTLVWPHRSVTDARRHHESNKAIDR